MTWMLIDGKMEFVDQVSSKPEYDPNKGSIYKFNLIGIGKCEKDIFKHNNPNNPNDWTEKLYYGWKRVS